ncbi:glycosyltransferase family 4 protein [Mucilaginibacter pallidiroseus]|uniref:Glycosyltransferase family 4 protein n=1 Tax=Mucilaginibacter pallidiroseus TaxID=2599295 RepID=A0A563U0P4_9SPHI|nr:glycosyltransferase family 4 protein [Mucilaginibacter pallidiroseus]TWR25197.1 glycosyltransferase family 4 protein [Mucilaginibacter pallidiroseus]
MKKLAIITTHPIQYYAPVFKLLHSRGTINVKVFYTIGHEGTTLYDPGFGKKITWDIPLLDGYPYIFVKNTSGNPGSHHYNGIANPSLMADIESWGANIVLIFGWAYKSHLKAMRYFKGRIPVLFRGDSTLIDQVRPLKKMLRQLLLTWVYRHIDFALYPGKNTLAYFKKYGVKKLVYAPHAVDNERFSIAHTKKSAHLRLNLNIPETATLILYAGKFDYKKDPQLLLQSFKEACVPNTHLLFVGDGMLEIALKNEAASAGNVHFMPFQNQTEMPAVYQAADLFCLPSRGPNETWGLAVNEAMACGKAILVSSKVGCAPDLVKDGFNGATFQAGDKNDLIKKLTLLTASKDTLKQYGRNSFNLIQRFNFTNIVTAIEETVSNFGV